MAGDNKRITFLKRVIDELNNNDTFFYVNICENLENYIWIGTRNGIGITDCHYEIIFQKNNNVYAESPSVEVHFEDSNFRNFQNIKLPDWLKYKSWSENFAEKKFKANRRIVYSNKNNINIKKSESALEILVILKRIHDALGKELEKRINCIIKQEKETLGKSFSDYGKVIFGSKLAEYRYLPERQYLAKTILIEHVQLQKRLINYLIQQHKKNSNTIELPGIYVESLLSNSKRADIITNDKKEITIYEVKSYLDVMHCIREALGQLFEYRWRLSQIGLKVNKLVIVGSCEETEESQSFLKEMNNDFSLNEIDGKTVLEYLKI